MAMQQAGGNGGGGLDDLFEGMTDEERQQTIHQLMQMGALGGQEQILGQQAHQIAQSQMFQPRAYGWGAGLGAGLGSIIGAFRQKQIQDERFKLLGQQGEAKEKLYDLLYGRRRGPTADQAWQGINEAGGLPGEGTGI